ncbi:unnamed protein product [Ilex paraguariensis]|uniref:RNase H type-1 domain-containing protein n=1 Tax=Ilex paraguariensis TaxID=185542 RepID=A0ABC8U6P4_9AQUA
MLNSYSIYLKICSLLRFLVRNVKPKVRDGDRGKGLLIVLGIEMPYAIKVKASWVVWEFPSAGSLKMDVDGAAKGKPGCAGGGVLVRNEWGGKVLAASFYYGVCTNMAAEFKAMLDGLNMLMSYGLEGFHVFIESDSLVVVNTIKGLFQCAWPYLGIMEKIMKLLDVLYFQLRHVYLEANFVADGLANKAVEDGFSTDFSSLQLPAMVKMKLLQDQRSLPVLRKKTVLIFDDGG